MGVRWEGGDWQYSIKFDREKIGEVRTRREEYGRNRTGQTVFILFSSGGDTKICEKGKCAIIFI